MLGKLLKYDLKAVGKYWWIVMVVMLGLFGTAGISFGGFQFILNILAEIGIGVSDEVLVLALSIATGITEFFLIATFSISLMGIGGCFIAVAILIYVRYFKHLFTDEGYLTFTLPVSRAQIFNAKVINAVIWVMLTGVVTLIGAFIMMMFISVGSIGILSVDSIKMILGDIASIPLTQWLWFALWGIIIALIAIAGCVLEPCAAYFCITLGATVFKRAKLFAAIGTYLLMNHLVQRIIEFASYGFMFYLTLATFGIVDFIAKAPMIGINALITVALLVVLAMMATVTAILYCATRNIIERKLNLA